MAIKVDYNKCKWENGKCDCRDSSSNSGNSDRCCCSSAKVISVNSCCSSNDNEVESGCGCEEVCPVGAITREDVVKIDLSSCIECGVCVDACPYKAISI